MVPSAFYHGLHLCFELFGVLLAALANRVALGVADAATRHILPDKQPSLSHNNTSGLARLDVLAG